MKSVSIVLCTYNGEKFLREQLDSILAQTYPIKEIVVQDDGSQDSTMKILHRYDTKNPGLFRIYQNPVGGNINRNFFTCASRAKGDYIAFSDQDDIWRKDKVATLIENIGINNICFHSPYHFYGEPPSFDSLPTVDPVCNFGIPRQLFIGSVPGHSMIISKQFLDYVLANVPNSELYEAPMYYDTILSIIASTTKSISCHSGYLTLHRCHTASITAGGKQKAYFKRNFSNFFLQILRGCDPRLRRAAKPIYVKRFLAIKSIINHFPRTEISITAIKLIDSYFSPICLIKFPLSLIQNKDEIFYKKENNRMIATIRALLFPITMYNYVK